MTIENDGVNTPENFENPNGSTTEVIGNDAPNPLSLDDVAMLKAELEKIKSTNNRLLEESKKYKQQKREVDLKLMEAEGKKDEIIQTLQKELEEKQTILSEKMQREIDLKITNAVAQRASKYGCEDWDHLMQLGKSDLIEYDENTGDVKGVDLFFEDAMRNDRFKKFFIKMDKVKTNNRVPSMEAVDWKSDPLPYLRQLKKEKKFTEYNKAIQELEKSGLLK